MDLVEEIRKKEKGHYEFTQILEAISRIDLPQPVVDLQPILAAIRNLNVHVDIEKVNRHTTTRKENKEGLDANGS
eukprot:1271803-Amphidinium_carterae.1